MEHFALLGCANGKQTVTMGENDMRHAEKVNATYVVGIGIGQGSDAIEHDGDTLFDAVLAGMDCCAHTPSLCIGNGEPELAEWFEVLEWHEVNGELTADCKVRCIPHMMEEFVKSYPVEVNAGETPYQAFYAAILDGGREAKSYAPTRLGKREEERSRETQRAQNR